MFCGSHLSHVVHFLWEYICNIVTLYSCTLYTFFLHTGNVNTFASIGTFLHQVFPVLCFGHTDI